MERNTSIKNTACCDQSNNFTFPCFNGIGFLMGFTNIFLTYSLVDEKPGLGLKDISLTYYGARDKTTLEKAIDGSMRQYFADKKEYQDVKDWVL